MNAMSQIAEARASALSLRASAGACGPEQGPLKFRLMRAAESLDAMVLLAVRGIERVEVRALQPAEEADVGDALREVHARLEHARQSVAEGMRAVDRFDHAIIVNALVLLDHHAAVELSDARTRLDSEKEMAMLAMARQIARLRAKLRTMAVSL